MGFDYAIHLCLTISPTSGEAFVGYGFNGIPYDAEKHRIPEDFRKYLNGRGRFFLDYMPKVDNGEIFSDFVDVWYEKFPSWEDIDHDMAEAYGWTEEDHDNFKNLLKWFLDNNLHAIVTWSY